MRRTIRRALLAGTVLIGLCAGLVTLVATGASGAVRGAAAHRAQHHASSALPPALAQGKILYDTTCSSCHGIDGQGSPLGLSLLGRGAATIDLWVSSGWMPLAVPTAQPIRKPNKFTRSQTIDIANYVASLKPGGPAIPTPDLAGTNLASGAALFAENCAGCHTITGAGDALSGGYNAPTLHGLTATEINEAVLTAPGQMPHFYPGALTKPQMLDVIAYVHQVIDRPANVGGIGLGGVGPVAEGFVGLFIGVGATLLFALWIGDRSAAEESHDDAVEDAHV